jgi:hypothetical protein
MTKPVYKLARPLTKYQLSASERARIERTYGADATGVNVTVTVYPAGKRRKRIDHEPREALPYLGKNNPKRATGSLLQPGRHYVDNGGELSGTGLRQTNWLALGSSAATLSGREASVRPTRDWDRLETAPWVDDDDTTYRWDHRLSAYVYSEHGAGVLAYCKRASAYGARVDHAVDRVEIRGNRQPVLVERRKPRAHKGLSIPAHGLAS